MAESRVDQSVVDLITLADNQARVTQSAIILITDGPLAVVSCNNPPSGPLNQAYTHTFTATLGNPPYTFSISAGALPTGLTMNAAGVVTGTPTAIGTFNFTVQVIDATPRTSTVNCSITIFGSMPTPQNPTGGPVPISGCHKRNQYDWCLFSEELEQMKITFPPMCTIPEEYRHLLPWDDEFGGVPPQARTFRPAKGILTPGPGAGDVLMVELTMPVGYDGLLSGIFQFYTGSGFIQGSGDIIWRIQVNQRYVKDLGNSPFSLGSPREPFPLTEGQILLSGQTVRYLVNVPNLSGNIQVGNSQIVCGLIGFYWPRG